MCSKRAFSPGSVSLSWLQQRSSTRKPYRKVWLGEWGQKKTKYIDEWGNGSADVPSHSLPSHEGGYSSIIAPVNRSRSRRLKSNISED